MPHAAVDAPSGARARVAILLAALLSGFAGLGLEALLLGTSGLALGYGASAALGLSAWLVAWAAGAWAAAAWVGAGRAPAFPRLGLAVAACAPLSTWALLALGDSGLAAAARVPAALLAIGAPAFLQGLFLPWLARGTRDVAALVASNGAGAVLGAYVVSDVIAGLAGRPLAAVAAGVAGLVAGLVASAGGASGARQVASVPHAPRARGALSPRAAGLLVGLGVAWASAVQWILVRTGVLWFGGMMPALTAVLCASLVALAFGSALANARFARRVPFVLAACVSATAWPFVADHALNGLDAPLAWRALVLCVPALLPFGAWIPAVHAACVDERDAGVRLGRLLAHEIWGAAAGVPFVYAFVVPRFGLPGAGATAAGLGAVCALVAWRGTATWHGGPERTPDPGADLARTGRPTARSGPALVLVALAALALSTWIGAHESPVLAAPALANPAFTRVSFTEDRDFAVAVVDDGVSGERTLMTDGFRAAGTGRDYRYMEALGHLPLLLHPAPRRVAVLALGTGTTLGAVALDPSVERIDVLEISRAVVAAAPAFEEKNHGALAEGLPGLLDPGDGVARVVVRLGDGRATLAAARGAYDVITMEPLLPDSPFAVYLYTREFYARARAALAPGGLVCQWVPPHALEPVTFDAVLEAFAASFAWSGVWQFGTQVVLVGGASEPRMEPARFDVDAHETLRAARASLGLATVDDVVASYCGPPPRTAAGARALTDADPWIVHRPRRSGAVLLRDLPANLARLAGDADVPAAWRARASPGIDARVAGARALRRARIALAEREAPLPAAPPASDARDPVPADTRLRRELVLARESSGTSAEWTRFVDEIEFLDARREGLNALGADASREGAARALESLVRAAELRGERADVHLYCAVALERLGAPAATRALERALAQCPRIGATSAGSLARTLGLSDAAWSRLQAAAAARP